MYLSAASSIGRRETNQDSLLADGFFCQRGLPGDIQFHIPHVPAGPLALAICDGACERGDIASAAAVDVLYQHLEQLHTAKEPEDLRGLIDALNHRVCTLLDPERTWDGQAISTLSLLCLGAGRLLLCCIGDSPVYRLRDGELEQLSQNQTLAARRAQRDPDAVIPEEDRHVLTNYLGRRQGGGFDSAIWVEETVLPGDLFLLCSDGILERLPEKKLRTALLRHGGQAAPTLVKLAARSGSLDNLTALVVQTDRGTKR